MPQIISVSMMKKEKNPSSIATCRLFSPSYHTYVVIYSYYNNFANIGIVYSYIKYIRRKAKEKKTLSSNYIKNI